MIGLLLIALLQAAEPIPAPGADCSTWTINGYSLGMTWNAAREVRELKSESPGLYSTKEKGQFSGWLRFYNGELGAWVARHGRANYDGLKQGMTERFGVPLSDNPVGSLHFDEGHDGSLYAVTTWDTVWASNKCDVALMLRKRETVGPGPISSTSTSIETHLVRLSSLNAVKALE